MGRNRTRPAMIKAIVWLHKHGIKVATITNNWKPATAETEDKKHQTTFLFSLFDVVIESSVVGLRKPDPRIYNMACDRLGVAPTEVVFLDDIGKNLKTAQQMGIETIKVMCGS